MLALLLFPEIRKDHPIICLTRLIPFGLLIYTCVLRPFLP
jgi:hypothetical protein